MAAITGINNPQNILEISDEVILAEIIPRLQVGKKTMVELVKSANPVANLAQSSKKSNEMFQSILKEMKDLFLVMKGGYHSQIVDTLLKRNISLWNLPTLDLGKRMHADIDFITQPEMVSPLMKFTDKMGRVGLAFRLLGKVNPIQGLSATVAVFKRYANNDEIWAYGHPDQGAGVFNGDQYFSAHEAGHPKGLDGPCPTCPTFLKMDFKGWACVLIDAVDPLWAIDGDIEQVERNPGALEKVDQ